MQQHAEAHVRTVTAVVGHGLRVGHAPERHREVKPHRREHLMQDVFHHGDDVVFSDEGHFDVHLREFRLTVSTQVLVAEAARDLEVALNAAGHEHLLELLRALRQRVELARVRAGRHDVVARALRRGVRQDGRFHFQETALVQRAAHGLGHRVAQLDVRVHLRTAQVKVAPLHAGGLVRFDAVFNSERRRDGFVQHLDAAGQHLYLASGHVRIHGVFRTQTHAPGHLQHVFAAHVFGLREVICADAIRIHHHLRVAVAVAQVYEDEAAMVAVVPRPARERDFAPVVRGAELAAGGGVHAVFVDEVSHRSVSPFEDSCETVPLYAKPPAPAPHAQSRCAKGTFRITQGMCKRDVPNCT